MDNIDFSIPRYMHFKSELRESTKCPDCHTTLTKQFASYLVFVRGEKDALMMGNDDGYFCPACPVVALDEKAMAKTMLRAKGGSSLAFHVAGIVDINALPTGKSGVPLGADDNPIPLVAFLNYSTAGTHGPHAKKTGEFGLAGEEVNEKEMLAVAVNMETGADAEAAIVVLDRILQKNPSSYHALFLKARNLRKSGRLDEALIKHALVEALRQNASKGVFEVMAEEIRLQYSFDKNGYVMQELLGEFTGQKQRLLEKALGYTQYLELQSMHQLGKPQEHALVVDAFLTFVNGNPKVIKTDDGTIREITELPREAIKKNLLLLEREEGLFYDDDLRISYAFLGENFFAYVMQNTLMFSAKKDDVGKMAGILDSLGLKYCAPYELSEESLE